MKISLKTMLKDLDELRVSRSDVITLIGCTVGLTESKRADITVSHIKKSAFGHDPAKELKLLILFSEKTPVKSEDGRTLFEHQHTTSEFVPFDRQIRHYSPERIRIDYSPRSQLKRGQPEFKYILIKRSKPE